jgi:hypothetical protein
MLKNDSVSLLSENKEDFNFVYGLLWEGKRKNLPKLFLPLIGIQFTMRIATGANEDSTVCR